MGATNLYYLNGPDLASATSVYTDIFLTNLATDGWYSADGIVRQQLGGVLQTAAGCISCGYPCSLPASTVLIVDPTAIDKEYILPMNVGNSVGCVRVDITPTVIAGDFSFGVKAYYGSIFKNAVLESPGVYTGYYQSQSSGQNMTVIVRAGSGCFIPPVPNPFIFEQYKIDSLGNANLTGNTTLFNVLSSDIVPLGTLGSTYTMFIPKITAAANQIDLYLYGFANYCVGADLQINFSCPSPLPMVLIHTITYPDNIAACAYTGDDYQQLYIGYINGTPGSILPNDVLFMDSSAYTPFAFPPGWYLYTTQLPIVPGSRVAFEVDANGVVINSIACP